MLFNYGQNSLAVELQGIEIGAPRWGIIATYCYVRRFYPGAIFSRVEKWDSVFLLYWTRNQQEQDEHATIISRLWSRKTAQQPEPLDKNADYWIADIEKLDAEQRAKDAKYREKKTGKRRSKRRGQDDELLMATKESAFSFEREAKPIPEPKSDYDKMLENLF